MKLSIASLLLGALPLAKSYSPWPLPASYTTGTTALYVSQSISFSSVTDNNEKVSNTLLSDAFQRYSEAIAGGMGCSDAARSLRESPPPQAAAEVSTCTIKVSSPSNSPSLSVDTDESYDLSIGEDGSCKITATTEFGVIHALESLSHLAGESCSIENAPINISDKPRFAYRGLMIDSARHFLPVHFIEHIIDTMAASKLNVLHWHISDTESFPSGSDLFPELAEKGAYTYPDASYSVQDLKGIVSYAYNRGIRVMPEWDVPGHGSWGKGKPEVTILDGSCSNTLDPTNPYVYTFLHSFLTEMADIFPDANLFLGGDEVDTSCFTSSPTVSKWMDDNSIEDGVALQSYFWQQVTAQVMPGLNKTLGVWMADDGIPYPEDLPEGSFGNVWQSQSMMPTVIDRGADVVLSGPWYLDQQQPGGFQTYALQAIWQGMYQVEPFDGLSESQQGSVLGGEACMWAEGVNAMDFDAIAVTKAAAVAERLWAEQTVVDVDDAQDRLMEHVCRLNMRGVAAKAIAQNFCLSDVL
ncbi:hypothetical protein TrST_g7542 [Triparma strigata]|uniref:Beta-hexosaminidase n=1 Tax=Triparma strigata TaxID=1606541 RepID=A0A9W7E392_9STRA|nr:hypothetical protein TrST_g7542 [Triparma strigata]